MSEPAPIGATSMTAVDVFALFVVDRLTSHPLPLDDEKHLQSAMADLFAAEGLRFEREKTLGDGDICDFLLSGGIAVEAKIKGGRLAIFRQCRRYCGHDEVRALVLATNVSMALPNPLNGKSAHVALLGAGWL